VISRPILQLVEATRQVSANSDFSVRVVKQSQDELGVLCDAFNAMLVQIQERDEELASHRVHLEDLVRERTGSLEAKTRELARSNLELERSSAELQQFTLVSSHDLQEPLRKVQAFGDLLQTECAALLTEQGNDYLRRMRKSAARARELIDALLTYTRIMSKKQPLAPVDLAAVAQATVADLDARIRQVGGRVQIGELPSIDADRTQMRQLLHHLIDNGLKYHRPAVPPVVEIAGSRGEPGPAASLPAAPGSEFVRITVKDNGVGFDEKYLDRIFAPYERLQNREQAEGAGMGLAICRRIVERHGGTITARSAPGQGATFIVTLPVRQAPPV
jgi:light-regulated signal transduction histidine kinase (bacteriophytochrome)